MEAQGTRPLKELFDDLKRLHQLGEFVAAGRVTGDFVIRLIDLLLTYGVQVGASDLHIEPAHEGARVRFRIDGALHELLELPSEMSEPLIRSIKTRANLTSDAVGRSKPQDGRLDFTASGKSVDVRLSCFPAMHGDVLAMRLLLRSRSLYRLEQLGFHPKVMQQFFRSIHRPNGLLLVTGPTNSGKTTTLYAALEQLRSPRLKIVTLEDPVEYQLAGIDQAQINPQVGFTFASGLRSILRQDANIILVGEIRDVETAEIAIRAALTGHLVLSTLHTRNACGAVTRLIEMGIEPYLILAVLNGVLGVRLVRHVCKNCRQPDAQAAAVYEHLMMKHGNSTEQHSMDAGKQTGMEFVKGAGCDACNGSGYQGRSALYEFLVLSDSLKEYVLTQNVRQLNKAAIAAGMRTMIRDGLEKASQGLTTIDEVLRVVGESDDL